jgi:DNA-binding NtrC family response regulator
VPAPPWRHGEGSLTPGQQRRFVFLADSPTGGFAVMDANPAEAVILAEQMAGCAGRDILARIRAVRPEIPVLMLVNGTRPTNAALVVNHGAFDPIIQGMHITLAALALTRAVRYAREIARPRMGARASSAAEALPAASTGKG